MKIWRHPPAALKQLESSSRIELTKFGELAMVRRLYCNITFMELRTTINTAKKYQACFRPRLLHLPFLFVRPTSRLIHHAPNLTMCSDRFILRSWFTFSTTLRVPLYVLTLVGYKLIRAVPSRLQHKKQSKLDYI